VYDDGNTQTWTPLLLVCHSRMQGGVECMGRPASPGSGQRRSRAVCQGLARQSNRCGLAVFMLARVLQLQQRLRTLTAISTLYGLMRAVYDLSRR
jgi:hypothetical protein